LPLKTGQEGINMKTAMIWGAAGGIGKECLKILQENDWTTLGIARAS